MWGARKGEYEHSNKEQAEHSDGEGKAWGVTRALSLALLSITAQELNKQAAHRMPLCSETAAEHET